MNQRGALQPLLRDPRLWRGDSAAPIRAQATGHAALDAVLPGGGWPMGALSEILYPHAGVGELSVALPLLARLTQRGRHVAFVAPRARPYAPALTAAGVQLSQVLVVAPRDDTEALWVSEQLLRARAGAVLLWGDTRIDTTALRRLQLAAETGEGIGMLYRPPSAEHAHSIAALRLRIELRDGERQVEVLKCRGVRPSGWHALGDIHRTSVGRASARHAPAAVALKPDPQSSRCQMTRSQRSRPALPPARTDSMSVRDKARPAPVVTHLPGNRPYA